MISLLLCYQRVIEQWLIMIHSIHIAAVTNNTLEATDIVEIKSFHLKLHLLSDGYDFMQPDLRR